MSENVVVHGKSSTQTVTGDSGKHVDVPVEVTSAALHTANMAQEPGHDADYDAVNGSIPGEVCTFATADDLQVTGPCRVMGYVVRVATATAVIEVEDGLTDAGTSKFSIPSGAAVGVYHFGGIGLQFDTGAFLDYGSATGTVALIVQLAAGSTMEA